MSRRNTGGDAQALRLYVPERRERSAMPEGVRQRLRELRAELDQRAVLTREFLRRAGFPC